MCIICVELDKKKLSPWEAAKNRTEMLEQFDQEHLEVLDVKIQQSLLEYLNNLPKEEVKEESDVQLWF